MAEFLLRSKRPDREPAARELFTEISTNYPDSPWAPRALVRKAALEERAKLRVVDPQLNTSVPAALVSYRTLVERYPSAEATESSLDKLADMYEDLKRYDLAARSLDDLAARFPDQHARRGVARRGVLRQEGQGRERRPRRIRPRARGLGSLQGSSEAIAALTITTPTAGPDRFLIGAALSGCMERAGIRD